MASSVAASVPPIMPVPIATRLLAPAPVAIASGVTPAINASEVMIIGRRRVWALRRAARQGVAFGDFGFGKLDNQNGILRRQTDGGQQRHLEVDVVAQATQEAAMAAPSTPSGITRMTEMGTDQLSYSAARHRNTTRMERA